MYRKSGQNIQRREEDVSIILVVSLIPIYIDEKAIFPIYRQNTTIWAKEYIPYLKNNVQTKKCYFYYRENTIYIRKGWAEYKE